jgi:hypothetical protein
LFEVLGEALSSNKAKDAEIKRLKAVVAGYDKLIFKLSGKISIANDSKTVEIRHAGGGMAGDLLFYVSGVYRFLWVFVVGAGQCVDVWDSFDGQFQQAIHRQEHT